MCDDDKNACLAFHSPDKCSNGTDVHGACVPRNASDSCAFECFSLSESMPIEVFAMRIPIAKIKGSDGRWSSANDSAVWIGSPSGSGDGDKNVELPAVSNDKVAFIGKLRLASSISSVDLIGDESIDGVKGNVANVKLTDGFLPTESATLRSVRLRNLNIGAQLATSVSKLLPTTITVLDISNTKLNALPTGLDQFSSLITLRLDQNNIKNVPDMLDMPSLRNFSISNNGLEEFNGMYPNLECLHLQNNSLSSMPSTIFMMRKLRSLDLSNNPMKNVALTSDEFTFLSGLSKLRVDQSFLSECATPKYLTDTVTKQQIPVCTQERKDDAKKSGLSFGPICTTIAVVVVLLLIIIAYIMGKRRRSARASCDVPPSSSKQPTDFKNDHSTGGSTGRTVMSADSMMTSSLNQDPVLRLHRLEMEDIQDLHKIGSGAYGVVWLVSYRNNQQYASKRLRGDNADEGHIDKFIDEIKLNARFDHRNIVQFIGVAWNTMADLQSLFEYLEQGDLRTWLKHTDASIGWTDTKLAIAANILEALVYVHSFSPAIVHRDLKSSNVLLTNDFMAKLCDFGVARFQSTQQTMTVGVGTSLWLAPEIILGSFDYDYRADMYSFGVLLSELDTHELPYDSVRTDSGHRLRDVAIIHQVGSGTIKPSFQPSCPEPIRELADRCLAFNPNDRPAAMEASYMLCTIRRALKADN